MNINIQVIPPSQMRPEVDGADWYWDEKGDLQVRVCPMSDWRYEVLLAIHEAVEAVMCMHNGVTQAQVDEFDKQYDLTHDTDVEAGDDPAAPYKKEHCLATAIERILCSELGVDWKTYDDELNTVYRGPRHKAAQTPPLAITPEPAGVGYSATPVIESTPAVEPVAPPAEPVPAPAPEPPPAPPADPTLQPS